MRLPTKWIAMLVLLLALTPALMACNGDEPSASPTAERAASTSTTPDRSTATPKPTATAPESTTATTPDSMPALDLGSVETDREALVALYNATDGDNWTNNTNWMSGKPLDEWQGVTAEEFLNGRVTALDLGDNGLSGEIPPELEDLLFLTYLDIDGNQLTGCVSDRLGEAGAGLPVCRVEDHPGDREVLVTFYNATGGPSWSSNTNWLSDEPLGEWYGVTTDRGGRVTGLDLDFGSLDGEIPAELGSLANLMMLELQDNRLSGEIPAELGNLTNLITLALGGNELSGGIPVELGNLTNLVGLALSANELSGEIPAELGRLTNLTFLLLDETSLSGCVPSGLQDRLDMGDARLGDLVFCSDGNTPTPRKATPTPDRTVSAATEETTAPWLYRMDADAIAHISVTHMGKTVEYEKTEGGWVIKDGSDTPVYEELWAGTPLLLSSARSTLVSPNIDDLGAYGLDDPQTAVTLTDGSGARLSYALGDPTPDGHSWYAALKGDDSLHTLPSVWCELVSRLATAPPYPPATPESTSVPDRTSVETYREALVALYNLTGGDKEWDGEWV